MDSLEKLYDKLYSENINVIDAYFSSTKKAVVFCDTDFDNILLDKMKITSMADERVVLGHERMHIKKKNYFYISEFMSESLVRINQRKAEADTRAAHIEEDLPKKDIQTAINNGCFNSCEIAEYLDFTPEFVTEAMEHYTIMGHVFTPPPGYNPDM